MVEETVCQKCNNEKCGYRGKYNPHFDEHNICSSFVGTPEEVLDKFKKQLEKAFDDDDEYEDQYLYYMSNNSGGIVWSKKKD